MQHRQYLRRQVDDILALFHGDLFADGLAADRQSGNERRDHGGYDDTAPAEAVLQQHDDDRRGRAAVFAGAGIGIEYGDLWFYHDRYKDWLCETSNIPLFINLKGYYPVAKKIEPYVSLSLGYAYNIDEYSGFYCDASIGIRLWKFCVGIGFIHHECTGLTGEDYYNNTFEDELWTRNKFQVKIGFQW